MIPDLDGGFVLRVYLLFFSFQISFQDFEMMLQHLSQVDLLSKVWTSKDQNYY